ncbi:hypothetical protein [Mesorhizobium sp. Mes31]|uniref:hypothetical protein n=1 Tax=Mesorhizobium sp. Mes31 TaxID=2926017 RepID=UPI0021177AAA|nr:hypothetical protein [Mesorhizobium sp. Mes31]
MTERRHKDASFASPHPDSCLAFLLAGANLLATDLGVELYWPPFEIQESTPPQVAAWMRRVNPLLTYVETEFREYIINDLRAAGMSESRLAAPRPAEVEAYIERRLRELRLAEMAVEQKLLPGRTQYRDQFKSAARVIAGVVSVTPLGRSESDRFNRVAAILNRDAPKGLTSALTGHHIRRADARYRADLLEVVNAGIRRNSIISTDLLLRAEMIGVTSTVRGLLALWEAAKKHPRFGRLKGSELAGRIRAEDDFSQRFTRALELTARQTAA